MKQKRMGKGHEDKDFNAHDVDTYGNFENEKDQKSQIMMYYWTNILGMK